MSAVNNTNLLQSKAVHKSSIFKRIWRGLSFSQGAKTSWNERALIWLNGNDQKLDKKFPNLKIQNQCDVIGSYIQSKLRVFDKFNQWLDSNGEGHFANKLLLFVAKLPMRAARNIIRMFFQLIKAILYTAVHPLKALNQAAKLLVKLAHALTRPHTWSLMGAGMIGAGFGQALVTMNPYAVITTGIGAALSLVGLSWAAIEAAVKAKKGEKGKAVLQALFAHAKSLPEAATTGFMMGLMMGGIQKAIQVRQFKAMQVKDDATARAWADKFADFHKLPKAEKVWASKNNSVDILWKGDDVVSVVQKKLDWVKWLDQKPTYQKIFVPGKGYQLIKNPLSVAAEFNPMAKHHMGMVENFAMSQKGPIIGTAAAASR